MLLPCTENSHDPFDRFLLTNKRRIDILTSQAARTQDPATTHPSHDELILVEGSPRTTQGTGKGVCLALHRIVALIVTEIVIVIIAYCPLLTFVHWCSDPSPRAPPQPPSHIKPPARSHLQRVCPGPSASGIKDVSCPRFASAIRPPFILYHARAPLTAYRVPRPSHPTSHNHGETCPFSTSQSGSHS